MNQLSKTELKIAHGISQGLIEKEIADKLCVSIHTVHAHAKNIRKKLNARNIADVTRIYILSLDNPKLVLKSVFLLFLHFGIIWNDNSNEFRRVGSKLNRAAARNTKLRDVYYVS